MIKPTLEQIIELHDMVVSASGGSNGIRDISLIDSAINTPFQAFGGFELYPSIEEKAARLAYNLTMNHAFFDGNKRIGAMALVVFLEANKKPLHYKPQEIIDLFLSVASKQKGYNELLEWVKEHI